MKLSIKTFRVLLSTASFSTKTLNSTIKKTTLSEHNTQHNNKNYTQNPCHSTYMTTLNIMTLSIHDIQHNDTRHSA